MIRNGVGDSLLPPSHGPTQVGTTPRVALRAALGEGGDVEVDLLTPSDCVWVTLTGADPSDALGPVGRVAARGRLNFQKNRAGLAAPPRRPFQHPEDEPSLGWRSSCPGFLAL